MVRVLIDGEYSDTTELKCSAQQGSKLGPRLYSDYTRPLGRLVTALKLSFHCYADDTQLCEAANSKSDMDQRAAYDSLERSVNLISGWMFRNKLKLNQDKTEFLAISSPHYLDKIAVDQLHLKDAIVNRTNEARNLGVIMDTHGHEAPYQ